MKVPLSDDVSSGIIEAWCDVLVVVVRCWVMGDEMERDGAQGKRWKLI
jgi:hypothetical protein